MDEPAREPTRSGFGPGFLPLQAWPYRIEMAAATVALFVLLFYWRLIVVGALDVLATVFWLVWPDLAAFLPIGIGMRRARGWPSWGPGLYNSVHSFLPWAGIFLIWSALSGGIVWPLLGWAGHITMDRAVGFYLRAPTRGQA